MAFLKTTEITMDNNDIALDEYTALIDSDKIIMVILGNSDSIKEGVDLADELAETSPTDENRWVMWIKNHVVLKQQLETILTQANILEDDTPYEEIKTFCMTHPEHNVLSRVHKNGEMDFSRLEDLFVEAEEASDI